MTTDNKEQDIDYEQLKKEFRNKLELIIELEVESLANSIPKEKFYDFKLELYRKILDLVGKYQMFI